jgi:hypothetical protein
MAFFTKVAGVTYDGRQAVIRTLYRTGELDPGTEIVLKREPNNPYDSFAVAVLTKDGQSIGYIPKEQARQISINMKSGMSYRAHVSAVTGGDVGCAYGVNLKIECLEQTKTEEKQTTNKGENIMGANMNYRTFIEMLQKENFRYEENFEEGKIWIRRVGIDSAIPVANFLIEVREDDCIVSGMYQDFHISSDNLSNMGELLMRINDKYLFPQFVLDYDEKWIICKQRFDFTGELVNLKHAAFLFGNVVFHMHKYGNAIMGVSLGLQSPKDASDKVSD